MHLRNFHHMQFHSRELWLNYLKLVVRIEMAVEEEWVRVFFDEGVPLRRGNWKARFIKLSQKPQFGDPLSQCALPQQLLLPSKLCDNFEASLCGNLSGQICKKPPGRPELTKRVTSLAYRQQKSVSTPQPFLQSTKSGIHSPPMLGLMPGTQV